MSSHWLRWSLRWSGLLPNECGPQNHQYQEGITFSYWLQNSLWRNLHGSVLEGLVFDPKEKVYTNSHVCIFPISPDENGAQQWFLLQLGTRLLVDSKLGWVVLNISKKKLVDFVGILGIVPHYSRGVSQNEFSREDLWSHQIIWGINLLHMQSSSDRC